GIFMVPILITFFGFSLEVAVGAAMISLVPSTLISTYLNRKTGHVDFKMGILLELPTMVGVVTGTLLLGLFPVEGLELFFAAMVIFLRFSFFFKKKNSGSGEHGLFFRVNKLKPRVVIKNDAKHVAYRVSFWMTVFFGMTAGGLAGLFGVGGGFIKTPIMLKV